FATPARRKFLKTPRTEADAAEAAVRRLALAAPDVAFRCETEGRVAFDLPAQTRAARVAALLGADAAAALLEVAGERGILRLAGFAGAPTLTRPTTAGQTLLVNGRPVSDPVLRTAVRVAYRDVIAAGRHPVVVLALDLPPEEVDVNVHPAKAEVRFRDPDAVRSLVIGALGRALGIGAGRAAPRPGLRLVHAAPSPAGFAEAALPLAALPAARPAVALVPVPDAESFPLGAAVAQVLDTYIIAVAADGSLVLVDQHAAHERLTQEALRAQAEQGGVRAQPLLFPAVVDLPPAQAEAVVARAAELEGLGLELEAFGPGAVLVRALPALLGPADPAPLLRDLAEEFATFEASTALASRLDAVIARIACHGSIRAGRRLAQQEMDALLRRMEATPRAATCSHGRPTFLKLTRAEIERLFGRR
nr:DNA mismatch repair protein MutL [Rhodospirillales bacterium]